MPRQLAKKFWQTRKFKDLQKEWEEKLRDSGFVDHEKNGFLTQNALNCYRTIDRLKIEAKERYYELLGQFHHEEDYSCPIEEFVMERLSEGATRRQINRELKEQGLGRTRETVRNIIRFFEKKWQIKKT